MLCYNERYRSCWVAIAECKAANEWCVCALGQQLIIHVTPCGTGTDSFGRISRVRYANGHDVCGSHIMGKPCLLYNAPDVYDFKATHVVVAQDYTAATHNFLVMKHGSALLFPVCPGNLGNLGATLWASLPNGILLFPETSKYKDATLLQL